MQKKIPQRQCMGCRERKAKRELIRVMESPANLDVENLRVLMI